MDLKELSVLSLGNRPGHIHFSISSPLPMRPEDGHRGPVEDLPFAYTVTRHLSENVTAPACCTRRRAGAGELPGAERGARTAGCCRAQRPEPGWAGSGRAAGEAERAPPLGPNLRTALPGHTHTHLGWAQGKAPGGQAAQGGNPPRTPSSEGSRPRAHPVKTLLGLRPRNLSLPSHARLGWTL
ncbi:hypothetical protein MC885_020340 [Smutsia gigantea]|nr:hypothetical protein MC885_020340 [Smutsia gigantea]